MKKSTTTIDNLPTSYVSGAEAGYKLRTTLANGSATTREVLSSTVQRVKGFKLGLFGPGKTKEPKVVDVRMTPQLREWLSK
jgi:hypothetical protein